MKDYFLDSKFGGDIFFFLSFNFFDKKKDLLKEGTDIPPKENTEPKGAD